MPKGNGYTVPKLYDCKGDLAKNNWFVGFRFTDPKTGNRKPVQIRGGINWIHIKAERYAEAKLLCHVIETSLKDGWNPCDQSFQDYLQRGCGTEPTSNITDFSRLQFCAALDWALEQRRPSLARKSKLDYGYVVTFAKASAEMLQFAHLPIHTIKRKHVKLLLNKMAEQRQVVYDAEGEGKKFSGNSYNKYKRVLSVLFTELLEYEALEYNPCSGISKRVEIGTNVHRHATAKEDAIIKKHLRENCRRLYRFLAFEELTGLRPKEISGVQIRDIDWFNQCINVRAEDEKTKTREARKVPIPNALMKIVEEMNLKALSSNFYLFSRELQPGPDRVHRNRVTDLWRVEVKEKLGLDVTMYSFKGLGGEKKGRRVLIAKRFLNIPLDINQSVQRKFICTGPARLCVTDNLLRRHGTLDALICLHLAH